MSRFNKITLYFIDEGQLTLRRVTAATDNDRQTLRVDVASGEVYVFNTTQLVYTKREYVEDWEKENG